MQAAATGSYEQFPALSALPGFVHAFCGRVPGIDVKVDRALALERLAAHHATVRAQLGLADRAFVFGDQVHGRELSVVDAASAAPVAGVDGVLTNDPRVCLGVYVADCCAVYLADPVRRAIGLLHSGRKGSELGITAAAIARMRADFGSEPRDLIVQLSPCVRPPIYEVDFAALIRRDCEEAGVQQVFDCGTCTGASVDRYYSYRVEQGKTGRLLALLALPNG